MIHIGKFGERPDIKKIIEPDISDAKIRPYPIKLQSCVSHEKYQQPELQKPASAFSQGDQPTHRKKHFFCVRLIIDEQTGTVYFATGNPNPSAPSSCASPYTEAVIELNASGLSLIGSYQVEAPFESGDFDFGSTPTLFEANGQKMVGVVNKNGVFYAFLRDALNSVTPSPLRWQVQIGNGGPEPQAGSADISPAAWDGQNLYVAGGNTSISQVACQGSLRKLDPLSGNFIWQTCLQDGPVLGAVTVANGVAYIGGGSHLVAIDTSSEISFLTTILGQSFGVRHPFRTESCTSAMKVGPFMPSGCSACMPPVATEQSRTKGATNVAPALSPPDRGPETGSAGGSVEIIPRRTAQVFTRPMLR
jgi:hypothetical protein